MKGSDMRATDVIAQKRDGQELSCAEIEFFVRGLTDGSIPDYQVAAWAMATLLRGMNARETTDLTMAMVASGETLDLSGLGKVVDKHSTGGVGDKTTLVVAPMVSAVGLPVAKMSGRGLGFSGGTLDKLESIPGFNVSLSIEQFMATVRACGLVVAGQTADLAPADGKLYALRDVTATVPSLPLIASSIMSKKIAGGARLLVLDVKVGRGAFMTTLDEAEALAQMMIDIGERVDRRVTAVLSAMDQPLGLAVGNALEVAEAVDTLKGAGPDDFREHCVAIAAEMMLLGGRASSPDEAMATANRVLDDGSALERFRGWVAAQGGDTRVTDDYALLPQAPVRHQMISESAGFVADIDARQIGLASVSLGAGRQRKGDPIDRSVGIVLARKVGDRVETGDALCTIHARDRATAEDVAVRLRSALRLSPDPVARPPLIYRVIRAS